VRTHYPDADSARLALRGLEHLERFEEIYGGPSGFRATGFVYAPRPEEVADGTLHDRDALLRCTGIETELLDAGALHAIDPSLDISDSGVVAYEPRSGHAEPALTCATLATAARDAGADLRPHSLVCDLLQTADEVVGVALDDGLLLSAATTLLCAGAHSGDLVAATGLDLPLRPTSVLLAFVKRPVRFHLTFIDAHNGIYARPTRTGETLIGRRTWTDDPLASADSPLPTVGTRVALPLPPGGLRRVPRDGARRRSRPPRRLPHRRRARVWRGDDAVRLRCSSGPLVLDL